MFRTYSIVCITMDITVDTLRKYTIPFTGGMVVFDWVATLLFAYIVAITSGVSFIWTLIILLILSVALHYYYTIPTVTNYYLGISGYPSRR